MSESIHLPKTRWRASAAATSAAMFLSTLAPFAEPVLPLWWAEREVIDATQDSNNYGVANLGQAKWMATQALAELRQRVPSIASQIVITSVFPEKPENPDQAWYDAQKAPLNLGQLKALANPFYGRLPQAWTGPQALQTGVITDLENWAGVPWDRTTPVADNLKPANIGQLKSVFSLRFAQDVDNGGIGDGLPDLWEHVLLNGPEGAIFTDIEQITYESLSEIDEDEDGIGDPFERWVIDYDPNDGLHTLADVHQDNDSDGLIVIEEFGFGTDPTNSDALTLIGTPASDMLVGGIADDLLRGLEGDDLLQGGAGNDSYSWEWGHGWDLIIDSEDRRAVTNEIVFGEGISFENISVEYGSTSGMSYHDSSWGASPVGNDLRIVLNHQTNDALTGGVLIKDITQNANEWSFRLFDGSVYNYTDFLKEIIFGYSMEIVIDGYTGSETLTNFPFLVKLSNICGCYKGFLTSDGRDLRFRDSQGNLLDYEIDTWDPVGDSYIWVRIPTLTPTGTSITASWGSPAESSSLSSLNDGSVWQTNYQGVWHLKDAEDSSSGENHGTINGTDTVLGKVGSSQDFEGADSIPLDVRAFADITDSVTIELWQFGDSVQAQRDVIFQGSALGTRQLSVHLPWSNGKVFWDAFGDSGNYDRMLKAANPGQYKEQWNHWVFQREVGTMRIYLNGALWHSVSGRNRSYSPVNSFNIGSNNGNGHHYDGIIDEFRVSNTAHSADWVLASYQSAADPHSFASYQSIRKQGDGDGDSISDVWEQAVLTFYEVSNIGGITSIGDLNGNCIIDDYETVRSADVSSSGGTYGVYGEFGDMDSDLIANRTEFFAETVPNTQDDETALDDSKSEEAGDLIISVIGLGVFEINETLGGMAPVE
ncbi:DUF2341 domain-containing protein [Rubritalea spongiae]|uniref:DUF2341 domain-containing protein n=1 Tax=Rubritalea spongiae TaxID=430797 RepID=A0ABW5EAD4_9BACT